MYEALGTARRGRLHHQVGARLEAGYGTRAGEIAAQRAVHYWQQAGADAAPRLAHCQCDAGLVLEGQSAEGSVAFFRGDLMAARAHLEPCLSLEALPQPSAPTFHGGHHLKATHLSWMAHVLWELGHDK